jgi:hypothetical protein
VRAQRPLGRDDGRRRRALAVADDLLFGDHVDVAFAVRRAVVQRVDHSSQDLLRLVRVHRADLSQHAGALGHDVGGFHAAVQVAEVGGGLRVDPAVRHRCGRVGGGEDRRAALLRAQPGVGRLAVELGLDAVQRR